jgi:hypothetical protein
MLAFFEIGLAVDRRRGRGRAAILAIVIRLLGKQQLTTAIEHRGLCLYDETSDYLLQPALSGMYGFPPGLVKPGCTLNDVLAYGSLGTLTAIPSISSSAHGRDPRGQDHQQRGRVRGGRSIASSTAAGGRRLGGTHFDAPSAGREEHNEMAAREGRTTIEAAIASFRERMDKL